METEVIWALAVPEASTPSPGFLVIKLNTFLGEWEAIVEGVQSFSFGMIKRFWK